jgi:hypothetical protein
MFRKFHSEMPLYIDIVDLQVVLSKCHDFLWVGSCIVFIIMHILNVIHLGKGILVNMHPSTGA